MAFSKLIVLLMISMAFVMSARCQDDDITGELESTYDTEKTNDKDHVTNNHPTPTSPIDKNGILAYVKERVRKIIEKGKQVIKAAREAVSKSYSDFKTKTKEIIGMKQSEALGTSTISSLFSPSTKSDWESYTAKVVPSELYPESSSRTPSVPKNTLPESANELDSDLGNKTN